MGEVFVILFGFGLVFSFLVKLSLGGDDKFSCLLLNFWIGEDFFIGFLLINCEIGGGFRFNEFVFVLVVVVYKVIIFLLFMVVF